MFNCIVLKYSSPTLTRSQVKLLRTYVFSPYIQYFKLSPKIHKHDAEDVSYWLNSRDWNLTLHHPIEIGKRRAVEETEKADVTERVKRAKAVSTLTVGLGLTAAGI